MRLFMSPPRAFDQCGNTWSSEAFSQQIYDGAIVQGALVVRDIDHWIFEFERTAAPRLKEIFEQDLDGTPKKIIEQLDRLRVAEEQRRKSEPR